MFRPEKIFLFVLSHATVYQQNECVYGACKPLQCGRFLLPSPLPLSKNYFYLLKLGSPEIIIAAQGQIKHILQLSFTYLNITKQSSIIDKIFFLPCNIIYNHKTDYLVICIPSKHFNQYAT